MTLRIYLYYTIFAGAGQFAEKNRWETEAVSHR